MRNAHLHPVVSAVAGTLLLLVGACASPTPYQPLSSATSAQGGYSDHQLAADRYRVTFAGNTLTSRERVESYLLFRAAELTTEQGYDWFQILDREMDHEIQREIRPDPYYDPWHGPAYGEWRPYWRYRTASSGWRDWDPYHGDPFFARELEIRTLERFEATAEIKLGRGEVSQGDGQLFDARTVQSQIGPKVEYPGQ